MRLIQLPNYENESIEKSATIGYDIGSILGETIAGIIAVIGGFISYVNSKL